MYCNSLYSIVDSHILTILACGIKLDVDAVSTADVIMRDYEENHEKAQSG
jgi:hypothetical protein